MGHWISPVCGLRSQICGSHIWSGVLPSQSERKPRLNVWHWSPSRSFNSKPTALGQKESLRSPGDFPRMVHSACGGSMWFIMVGSNLSQNTLKLLNSELQWRKLFKAKCSVSICPQQYSILVDWGPNHAMDEKVGMKLPTCEGSSILTL